MCARNIKPENERWVLGMESRLASQTMPDGGSSRLAELLGGKKKKGGKKKTLRTFAVEDGVALLSRLLCVASVQK